MTNYVILDSEKHRHMRVLSGRGSQFGESLHHVPVVADELTSLALEYPIGFLKDHDTGQFGMHAILGFLPGENLFLEGDVWNASAIPLHILRQPFVIANTGPEHEAPTPENTAICIDTESNRVSAEDGHRLFEDNGEATDYLKYISSMLASIMSGVEKTNLFIQALLKQELLEPVKLSVTQNNGALQELEGLYAINKTRLNGLPDDIVTEFYRNGYLNALYLISAASGNFNKLTARQQIRHNKENN